MHLYELFGSDLSLFVYIVRVSEVDGKVLLEEVGRGEERELETKDRDQLITRQRTVIFNETKKVLKYI